MPNGDRSLPFNDVEKAMKLIHQHADEWNIDKNDIGIMGSSAGGHLAATYATHCKPELAPAFQILFYPVITTGWDPSPRTIQSEVYDPTPCYPWMAVMESTPEKLAEATRKTAELLMTRPVDERIMFFNAWNEWTEGSYLEPDNFYGMKMLEAIRNTLKPYADC